MAREARRRIAVVDEDQCTMCGTCAEACPERAISMAGSVVVSPTLCTGCGVCVAECPNGALSLDGKA